MRFQLCKEFTIDSWRDKVSSRSQRERLRRRRPLWVEGSAEGATWHHTNNTVLQWQIYTIDDSEFVAADSKLFYIQRKPSKRHQSLLEAG